MSVTPAKLQAISFSTRFVAISRDPHCQGLTFISDLPFIRSSLAGRNIVTNSSIPLRRLCVCVCVRVCVRRLVSTWWFALLKDMATICKEFPFTKYFSNAPQPLFQGISFAEDWDIAEVRECVCLSPVK